MSFITDKLRPADLPGVKKKSFASFFGGGEIWYEHLDGMYENTDLVVKKFEDDYMTIRKPSKPSLFAGVFDETKVNDEIIMTVSRALTAGEKKFTRVVIIGLDRKVKKKFMNALKNSDGGVNFALAFIDDVEKAKEWLVSETNNSGD